MSSKNNFQGPCWRGSPVYALSPRISLIPVLGFNLYLGILHDILEGRPRGPFIGYSGTTLHEVMGERSWTPFPFTGIHGGYKTFVIDIDDDHWIFDSDMSGSCLALTVRF